MDSYLLTAPSPVDPMVAFTLVVTAQDAMNNTVNDSSTTFFIEAGGVEFSDGAGGWSGNLGQRTLTNGTFSVGARLTSGGVTTTFVLSDRNGISGRVNVTSNATRPAGFVIDTIASPQVAGTPFTINVTALDSSNATMTGFNGTVSLFTNGAGTLTPATSGAFVNGVLTGGVTRAVARSTRTTGVAQPRPTQRNAPHRFQRFLKPLLRIRVTYTCRCPMKKQPPLGEREMDLLDMLWQGGPMTAAELQQHLGRRGVELAYNSVQTMLVRLFEKGVVRRTMEGRAYRYEPLAQQQTVAGGAVQRVAARFFSGSRGKLAAHLVESGLNTEDLDRLEALIRAERRKGKPS